MLLHPHFSVSHFPRHVACTPHIAYCTPPYCTPPYCNEPKVHSFSVQLLFCFDNFWPPSAFFKQDKLCCTALVFNCTSVWCTAASVVRTIQPYESEEAQESAAAGFYRTTSNRVTAPFLGFAGKARHPVVAESHQALIQDYNSHEKSNLGPPHLSALEPPS